MDRKCLLEDLKVPELRPHARCRRPGWQNVIATIIYTGRPGFTGIQRSTLTYDIYDSMNRRLNKINNIHNVTEPDTPGEI